MGLFDFFKNNAYHQAVKQNRQQRDNVVCCDDIDVDIDLAEEVEDEMQCGGWFSSDDDDIGPSSYDERDDDRYDSDDDREFDGEID